MKWETKVTFTVETSVIVEAGDPVEAYENTRSRARDIGHGFQLLVPSAHISVTHRTPAELPEISTKPVS